jgi:hypothetical protein
VAEAREFAVDPALAPGRILGGEAQDESADLDRGWWSSWFSVWLGPVVGDSPAMPSEEGVGGDEPAGSTTPGECGCDRAEQRLVAVVECRSVDLAAQDAELMAEHDDLEVLGATGTKGETSERSNEAVQNARHGRSPSAAFALVIGHGRIFGPHRLPPTT